MPVRSAEAARERAKRLFDTGNYAGVSTPSPSQGMRSWESTGSRGFMFGSDRERSSVGSTAKKGIVDVEEFEESGFQFCFIGSDRAL